LIDKTAIVDSQSHVARSANIWSFSQICRGAFIGENATIGSGVYVGVNVIVGENCKIQNHVSIYFPATIEAGVFIGPGVIFTNDKFPRAVTPEFKLKTVGDWVPVETHVKQGASIGAGSVCVAPLTIGRWALIAAGSVVTKDVPDFALMVGIPAKRVGWVGRVGKRLIQDDIDKSLFYCPDTRAKFKLESLDVLVELTLGSGS
jgi:UDP-2-acetamido-3-amino-2,3-dideoxy-glucuronate N-acetyltransferase